MSPSLGTRIEQEAARHEVLLGQDAVGRLTLFVRELIRWGRRHRLVGRAEAEEIVGVHLSDSLAWLRVLRSSVGGEVAGQRVVDVGSGAGFPGLVACCVEPRLRVVLNEPAVKRTSFLYASIHKIDLRCPVVESRVEELAHGEPGFDHAVSRAFRPPAQWLPLGRRLVHAGGTVWVMVAQDTWRPSRGCSFDYAYRLADGRERRVIGMTGDLLADYVH